MSGSGFARPNNRTIGLDRRIGLTLFSLLGTVQVTLIATITVITVALPAIQRDLHVDSSGLVLISSAYGLAFGGLLLLGGRLTDLLGRRRMFITGVFLFGLASVAAGLAPRVEVLLIARFAQGVGAALTAPAAMALLNFVFPDPSRRGRAMAVWGVLSSVGATVGTVLSGVVITWMSWRWVFLFPAVVSVVAVFAVARLVPADQPHERGRIDWLGAALATAGLVVLVYGLQHSVWTTLCGIALLTLFGFTERHFSAPLLPMPFLGGRALPLLAVAACAGAMATGFYLLSLYLQEARGLSALQTSAVFLVPVPAVLASSLVADRLIARLTSRYVLAIGLAIAAIGLLLLSLVDVPYPGLAVFPLGAGVTFSAAAVAALRDVRDDQAGLAGGLFNTAMEVGPPLGLAMLVSLASAYASQPSSGYPFALRIAAAALFVIALLSVSTHRSEQLEGESP